MLKEYDYNDNPEYVEGVRQWGLYYTFRSTKTEDYKDYKEILDWQFKAELDELCQRSYECSIEIVGALWGSNYLGEKISLSNLFNS